MKARLLSVLLVIMVYLPGAFSQIQNPDQVIPPDPAIRIGKLDNGLTYYIKYNKKPEQRAELRLAINAGSICETDGQQGLAHFLEHMCFNGTKNFPGNRLISMLEEMGVKFGAELNAYTSFDQTIYMLKIPTDSMEWINRGFQVLEDWAHQVSLGDEEIDKERGVIIEEWRLGLGADDRMMKKYIPVILKGSKYAERIPIGKIDVIKSFPHDTLRAMYKSWYRPDLMAVIVVGDIDPDMAEAKVKEYFNRVPPAINPPERIEYPVPGNKEPLISVATDREASGYSGTIFFKHPKSRNITYNDYRDLLIRNLFTGMLNKRYDEISQKPEAPFLYAGAGYGSFIGRSVDVYSLSFAAKENKIEESLKLTMTENERVARFGFTSTELEREKKDVLSYYESASKEADKTESSSYADEYIRNYMEQECIPGIVREYQIVQEYLPGITLEEINSLGKKLVTDENMAALITAQEKEGDTIPSEGRIREIISSVKDSKIEAYVDKISDAPLLKEMPAGTPVVKRTENTGTGYTEVIFGNGVRMILKPTDFKNDEIIFSAYSPGGSSLYPDKDIMSASLAATIISQSGLGEYDLTGLQKKLSGNTAKLNPYINELREGVNGSCSPKDLETMLQLNYLYFTGIRRDETAFNGYISRMRNMLKPMRSIPQVIYADTLSKIITKNNPRVITIPTDAQLEQVSLDRIMEIYRDRFADAGDFTYIMVGNFRTDEVLPLLEKYIGGLPSIKRKETWKNVTPGFPDGKISVRVPKNSEPQSMVAMVWKDDFKWKEKYRYGFNILMNILTIKCRESMREEQGGVYGVNVNGNATKLPKPQYVIQSSWGCNPEKIDTLSQTILNEMNKIIRNGPEEVDLNKVKETLVRERETRMKENNFWITVLTNHYLNGDRILSAAEYDEYINSFTREDIKAIARKFLDTDEYVQVALTPSEAALKK